MMKKHIGKADPADRFSCALCGGRQIVSGIIFKGRCICSECVKYLSAGSLSTDETTKAPVFFPDQFRVSRHLCKQTTQNPIMLLRNQSIATAQKPSRLKQRNGRRRESRKKERKKRKKSSKPRRRNGKNNLTKSDERGGVSH